MILYLVQSRNDSIRGVSDVADARRLAKQAEDRKWLILLGEESEAYFSYRGKLLKKRE